MCLYKIPNMCLTVQIAALIFSNMYLIKEGLVRRRKKLDPNPVAIGIREKTEVRIQNKRHKHITRIYENIYLYYLNG